MLFQRALFLNCLLGSVDIRLRAQLKRARLWTALRSLERRPVFLHKPVLRMTALRATEHIKRIETEY